MSKTPTRSPQPNRSTGSRSFERRQRQQRQRASRRRLAQARASRPTVGLRDRLRRVPRTAWIVALIALLNAVAWSIVTPPFQGRDEIDHYAYVSQLAETGKLPYGQSKAEVFSPKETSVTQALDYWQVRFTPYQPAISTDAQQRALIKATESGESLKGPGSAGGATHEAPLYYAIETIPYALGGGNVLIQLQLMRLLSALMGAVTALLVYMFLREVLPGVPWAATVGAICAALQPTFAFVTGSLNPDAMIYMLSAGVFLCLARGFRRRMTVPLAVVTGAIIAAGFVTYFSFIGVGIGAFAGLVVLAVRDARRRGRPALVAPGIAIGIGALPPVLYVLGNLLSKKAALGATSQSAAPLTPTTVLHEISYIWQLFLPRLPGMTHYFDGISTWREVWFDRSIGLYGWMDTTFPSWVETLALFLCAGIALLIVRDLVIDRSHLRARLPELAAYAIVTLGVLVMLGVASYRQDVIEHELAFGEPRYLVPLLPLLAALVALAVRGAGRRWMPVAGAALVVLFLGHDIFSQLQVIARYYG